jgi:hypothetical protein
MSSFSGGGKLSPWPEPKASPAHPHLQGRPRDAVSQQSRINSALVPLATHPAREYFCTTPGTISTDDRIDRIVLNAYFPMIQTGGGFRVWWRSPIGSDKNLDTTHLMRFAGHEPAEELITKLKPGFRPTNQSERDACHDKIPIEMQKLFQALKLAA